MREFDKRSKDFPRGDPGQVSFKSYLPIMKRYKQKSFDHESEAEIISSRPTSK